MTAESVDYPNTTDDCYTHNLFGTVETIEYFSGRSKLIDGLNVTTDNGFSYYFGYIPPPPINEIERLSQLQEGDRVSQLVEGRIIGITYDKYLEMDYVGLRTVQKDELVEDDVKNWCHVDQLTKTHADEFLCKYYK